MNADVKPPLKRLDYGGLVGPLWFWGWLFTLGFAGLPFWKGVLALVAWPYFLGVAVK